MTIQETGEAKLKALGDAFNKVCAVIGMGRTQVDEADIVTAFAALDAAIVAFETAIPVS
jgi:hypothetical protein